MHDDRLRIGLGSVFITSLLVFPGAGHYLCGKKKAGLLFAGAYLIVRTLFALLIVLHPFTFYMTSIFRVVAAIHSLPVAREARKKKWLPQDVIPGALLIFFIFIALDYCISKYLVDLIH